MGLEVRTYTGTPTAGLFAAGNGLPGMGTPIVLDQATDFAYYQRAGGTVAQIQGGAAGSLSGAWPVGSIYLAAVATDPATLFGFGTWLQIGKGQMLVGMNTGDADFGTLGATGGAKTASFTPSGTLDLGLYIAKGTVSYPASVPTFLGGVATVTASVSWPTGVPVFTGTQVTATASVNWPTAVPTFAGAALTVVASVNWPTGVPTQATASVSVTWPAAVPTFAGTGHQHQLPIIHSDNTVLRFLPTATFGVGASRVPDMRVTVTNVQVADVTNSGVVMLSQTVTAAGVITWPASVPQAVISAVPAISWPASVPQAQGSATPAGTNTWPASVPQAITSLLPAGVITWPATSEAAVVSVTPTGTIAWPSGKPVFIGATGSGSGIFSGIAAIATVINQYLTVMIWQRTA